MSEAGMSDARKARLIGAVALVLVAFLGLSWLLGGGDDPHKASTARSEGKVIVLPARPVRTAPVGAQAARPQAPPDEQSPAEPAPPPEPEPEPAPVPAAPEPAPQAAEPAPKPTPIRRPAPAPASGWYVQLGSFGSSRNAEALARKARDGDYRTEIRPQQVGGRTLQRVLVGPYPSEAAAQLRVPKLKNWLGETGRVVELPRD